MINWKLSKGVKLRSILIIINNKINRNSNCIKNPKYNNNHNNGSCFNNNYNNYNNYNLLKLA